MKKKKMIPQWAAVACLLFFLSLTYLRSSAQFNCGFVDPPESYVPKIGGASYCNDINRYIPGYITHASLSKQLDVNITVFVMCHAGDTMKDPFTNQTLKMSNLGWWFNIYNNVLSNIPASSVPNPLAVTTITDSKIRLKLANVVYVETTDNFINSHGEANTETEAKINALWPDGNSHSMVFFIGRGDAGMGGGNGVPYNTVKYFTSCSGTNDPTNWKAYINEWTVVHEFGHACGLPHTFCGSTSYCNGDGIADTPNDKMNCQGSASPSPDPNCPNNLMGYSNMPANPGYISPTQIAVMRRNLENDAGTFSLSSPVIPTYTTTLANCKKNPSGSAYIITTSQTWDKAVVLDNDLIIKPGVTLTVKCMVNMPEDGKVIVESGARLIVDEGLFTNQCKYSWAGIEVWGNSSVAQNLSGGYYPQGELVLINGAILENARNAVTNWKFGDYSKTGGLITASNSIFRNNGRAVEFITYSFMDKSKFDNCEFIVTRTLNHGGYCTSFVTAWGISGVKFRGCNFECKDKGLFGVAQHPKGIYTENANFSVTPLCTMAWPTIPCNTADMKPNTFKNLLYGIHATNGSTRTFLVDSAHFDTCMVAVQASNVNNFQVVRSKFDIRPYMYSPLSPKTGVWNDNGTGFKIQNNLFTTTYPVSDYLVGVYSNNTGTAANEIYRNVYQKMYYANNSASTNWSNAANALGLKYKCNTQTNNVRDLQVSNGTIGQLQGTLSGSTWLPAANTFSVTPDPVGHIANYGTNHMVYHHASVANQIPTKYTTANVFINTIYTAPPSDYCKSMLTWLGKQIAAEDFFQAKSSYDNTKYTYENLLDGGNTTGLIHQIEYSWPEEAWKLHETLMQRSPFLSMDVLYEVSDRGNVLPHALMLDIFVANPHCARDARFLEHLATKNNPMPQWMIDMLLGNSQKTIKDELEGIMAFHGEEWNRHADNLIRYYLTDSTDANPDSVWVWFNRKGDFASAAVLADITGGKTNYSGAIARYETLLTTYPKLEEEVRSEMSAKIDYYTLLERFKNGGNEYWVLTNDEQIALNGFAESGNTGAHHQAKNVLSFFYGYSFENIMARADGDNSPKSVGVKPANAFSGSGLVKVYPNPANDYATFEYNIPQLLVKKGMVLTIHNQEGKPLQSVNLNGTRGVYNLDVSKLASGSYIYNLTADGQKLDSGTLIVR